MSGTTKHLCSVASAAVVVIGVWTSAPDGMPVTESRTVQLCSATSVTAAVELEVGDLKLKGGADALLEAEFTYDLPNRRPEVEYHVADGAGALTIHQLTPDEPLGTDAGSEWDIRLMDTVPIGLRINLGAGDAALDMSTLELRELGVDLGAGDLDLRLGGARLLETANVNLGAGTGTIDLSGEWHKSCYVRLNVGAGDVAIVVPHGVGVRVVAEAGIGAVRVEGLSGAEDGYRNDQYGTAAVSVVVAVNVGVGEIRVRVAE